MYLCVQLYGFKGHRQTSDNIGWTRCGRNNESNGQITNSVEVQIRTGYGEKWDKIHTQDYFRGKSIGFGHRGIRKTGGKS